MNSSNNRHLPLVEEINKIFNNLQSISNDKLRLELHAIEHSINQKDNKVKALDDNLVKVYAIVKETARRFSEGNVVVTANDFDKSLADDVDFISIEGNKAIYKNHWDAGGVPFQWNMVHYDEQLLGGIMLHYGYAIEMATGEGKTLVATLPVLLNALTHEGVHLMTVNDYLSKRDFQMTRPIYSFLGLQADCIELYSRHDSRRKNAYKADITFGTNSSFTFDYLFDHLAIKPDECVQQNHHYAIIDELDSILIDEADTPHIVSGGVPYNDEKIFKENLPIVHELLEAEGHETFYSINKLNHSATFTEKGKQWLADKMAIPDLFSIQKTYQVDDFDKLEKTKQEALYLKMHLQNVLIQLLRAMTVYERDVDYIVSGDKIIIIDPHTGRAKPSHRWENGLHTAIEVKEGVKVQADSLGMAVISLKNYFKLYDKVCGMSGTIMPVEDELAEIYGIRCVAIPTHRPIIRIDEPLRIFRTTEQKDKAIIEQILANQQAGRPSLVGCINIKRSDHIASILEDMKIKCNRLDARTTKEEAITVAKAGIGNTITVSTSVAGRGTDIKPSDDAIANGGLMVIGTDMFDSIRVDRQLKGRSGRQGNPGTSIFFASLEDIILQNLDDEDRKILQRVAESCESDDEFNKQALPLFEKAQASSEESSREIRKEVARKDDIVAPHRLRFYTQRNKLLHDVGTSDELIDSILSKYEVSEKRVCKNLNDLYLKTRILVSRSLKNNRNLEYLWVSYSDSHHPFAIHLNAQKTNSDNGFNYFCQEFKRQITLQIYDKLWKDFVEYMMGNLDKHEIELLESRYDKMITEINSIIISRLLHSVSPFSGDLPPTSDTPGSEPQTHNSKLQDTVGIAPNDPCPCGSGKKYCECHGRGTRSSNRRKRRR